MCFYNIMDLLIHKLALWVFCNISMTFAFKKIFSDELQMLSFILR